MDERYTASTLWQSEQLERQNLIEGLMELELRSAALRIALRGGCGLSAATAGLDEINALHRRILVVLARWVDGQHLPPAPRV